MFFFQAEDGIRDKLVTGVQTCALPISSGRLVFRFAPTGESLGRAAVAFVREQLAPRLRVRRGLRYSVAYVDDVHGRAVAEGALEEVKDSGRSEEHTSELQSLAYLVCRLLLEKKKENRKAR